MFVDTHCHLDFDWFEKDRSAVIERARQADVTRMLNPGINLPSSKAAVGLANRNAEVFAAVGVHPNDGRSWGPQTQNELRDLAEKPKVVAIGEIGLDYYRDHTPQEVQRQVFIAQLQLAAEVGLPVVIHSRNKSPGDQRATQDVLDLLAEWVVGIAPDLAERPGVLHSYGGDLAMARQAVKLNFWIGITGPVTFRKADELRAVVAGLPPERLLIETDAPFLTPHPYRGKRNEPAHVQYVNEKIAQIHELPAEKFAEINRASAERLFDW